MNDRTFDQFTKFLGAEGTRRRMLRSMAAGVVTIAAASSGIEAVSAASKKRAGGNACRYDADCLSNRCIQRSPGRSTCSLSCANAVLVRDSSFNDVCVDDELRVDVNGSTVFDYEDLSTCFGPIPLGAVNEGDTIHVVATNSPVTCGFIMLSPLYLGCDDTHTARALDPAGFPESFADCGVVFYDRTFTVTG